MSGTSSSVDRSCLYVTSMGIRITHSGSATVVRIRAVRRKNSRKTTASVPVMRKRSSSRRRSTVVKKPQCDDLIVMRDLIEIAYDLGAYSVL